MVARTKRGFVNVFRPRRGSSTVARTRRGYAKVARLGCGSGMAPDPRLLGLVWSTYVFSFFSLFWQLKCTIIICLFVCCLLGSDTNVRLKGLGSGNHVWCQTQVRVWHGPRPTTLEFGMTVRPKSLGSGLTIKPNSLESCMIVKFKEFKTFSILLIFFLKKTMILIRCRVRANVLILYYKLILLWLFS
jgi:hypothetical protein